MAIRRLSRLVQAGTEQSVNWTTSATETFDRNDPAEDPVTWGTAAEIAYLDRPFTATGNLVDHLGMLCTFGGADTRPDRAFWGAQVKIQPTFTGDAAPFLELWTLLGATWTMQRRVSIPALARSGDVVVVDLLLREALLAADDALPDAVWIALDTATDVTLNWLVCHLYGDCTLDPTFGCLPDVDPENCDTPECAVDPDDWICTPLPLPPEVPPLDPFEFPPVTVDVLMPATYQVAEDGSYTHVCPGPTGIRMYFGDLPGGGTVVVTLVDSAGLVFAEGTTQTVSLPETVIDWTVDQGYGQSDPDIGAGSALGYLPPIEVTRYVRFSFTRTAADPFTLLDILAYFWTYDLTYEEVCFVDDAPPQSGLPPAEDPRDDAGQTDYQLVTETWFAFADTAANVAAARAAASTREAEYLTYAGGVLNYGLRPEDGALLRAAFDDIQQVLDDDYDPDVCQVHDHTRMVFTPTGLADGHVIAARLFVVPTAALMQATALRPGGGVIPGYQLNPFRNGVTGLPYNPTADIDTILCPPCLSAPCDNPEDEQTGDLAQRFRWQLITDGAPQITKYAGAAIQPSAYHLERGVTENPAYDVLQIMPYPVPDNPFAMTWDPPCSSANFGRCHQWFKAGWAYLVTFRVYEPVATPIGTPVTIAFSGMGSGGLQLDDPQQVDGRWP
jgi:hypothetical protein